jgi:hypothetical protein
MSRLPHFLDAQVTDGGEVVSLTRQLPFTPRKIPGTHFSYMLSQHQGDSAAGRIRSIEKSNDLIGNQTCDLLAGSIVPQPTILQCGSKQFISNKTNSNNEQKLKWNLPLKCRIHRASAKIVLFFQSITFI